MLEFQKVFLETLEDGISASSDFSTLETPSQFRVSALDRRLPQGLVGTVQTSPLRKNVLSPDCWQGIFSAPAALFPSGGWKEQGPFLSELCSGMGSARHDFCGRCLGSMLFLVH